MSLAKLKQLSYEEAVDFFAIAELLKTRSKAIQRFCLTYWSLKCNDNLTFNLSSLTQKILEEDFIDSRRTAYDYAHAIRFCEIEIASPKAPRGRVLGKIHGKPFLLSSKKIRQLNYILRKKGWTLSRFLEEVIEKEMLEEISTPKLASVVLKKR